jgi:hypothetical protein
MNVPGQKRGWRVFSCDFAQPIAGYIAASLRLARTHHPDFHPSVSKIPVVKTATWPPFRQ